MTAEKVETGDSSEEFYCKGQQTNEAVSRGRCRVKRVFFLRWEITISLCFLGMIQKRGCNY